MFFYKAIYFTCTTRVPRRTLRFDPMTGRFCLYGLLPWFKRPADWLTAFMRFCSCGCASIAKIPDFQQALIQGFDKNGRARLCVLPETRHTEDDVVGPRVVAGAIAIGHHRPIAAEHFHRCRNLEINTYNPHLNNCVWPLTSTVQQLMDNLNDHFL